MSKIKLLFDLVKKRLLFTWFSKNKLFIILIGMVLLVKDGIIGEVKSIGDTCIALKIK